MNPPIVAVVGLGYVGLPLAVEFGKKFEAIGYELSEANPLPASLIEKIESAESLAISAITCWRWLGCIVESALRGKAKRYVNPLESFSTRQRDLATPRRPRQTCSAGVPPAS